MRKCLTRLLSAIAVFSISVQAQEPLLQVSRVDTGKPLSQALLHGALVGPDQMDIVVVDVPGQGKPRQARIYPVRQQRIATAASTAFLLDQRIAALDIARINNKDVLTALTPGGVFVIDPVDGAMRNLVSVTTMVRGTGERQVLLQDFLQDLNMDGRSDLIL